jgi:hypothetical protein
VTIRFDCYENADEHLVRVLEVVPNSPAELAGLQPNLDFLLGTAEMSFRGKQPPPLTARVPRLEDRYAEGF